MKASTEDYNFDFMQFLKDDVRFKCALPIIVQLQYSLFIVAVHFVSCLETEKPPETVEQAEVKPEETQETAETPQPETEMKDATQTAEVPASDKTEEKPEAEAEAVPMGEIEKTDPTEKAGPPKKKGFFKFLKRTPKTSPPAECTAPKAEEVSCVT